MLKIPTKYLLLVNGLLWTAIGIKIALIGVDYYGRPTGGGARSDWGIRESSPSVDGHAPQKKPGIFAELLFVEHRRIELLTF